MGVYSTTIDEYRLIGAHSLVDRDLEPYSCRDARASPDWPRRRGLACARSSGSSLHWHAVSVAQATTRTRRLGIGKWLLERARPSLRELLITPIVFMAAGVAVFGSHVLDGGFYYDDWENSSLTRFAGDFGDRLATYWDATRFRPLLVPYVPTLNTIFGEHQHWFLAWALLTAVAMVTALFALLRTLGLERLHTGLISLLVLVFPFADVTKLWATSSVAQVVGALYFAGLAVAVRGIDRPVRRSRIVHHAIALALFAASVALYEIAALLVLGSVLVYWWRASIGAGWRVGLRRALPLFACDAVVVGAILVWNVTQTKITQSGSGQGALHHARLILDQGLQVFARTGLPFGTPRTATVLTALAVVVALGLLVARLLGRRDSDARKELWRWSALAGAGVLFAAASWVIFVPADDYYSPLSLGLGNRVNILAGVGLIVAVYAVAMVGMTLVFRGLPQWRLWAAGATTLVAVALGVGYVHTVRSDVRAWAAATREQQRILGAMRAAVPHPRHDDVLYTFGGAGWAALGVPVFSATWDLQGATRDLYDDKTLDGQPVITPSTFVCGPHGGWLMGAGYGPAAARPYGRIVLVDVRSRSAVRPANRQECLTAARRFPAGPYSLP
jgi:hypothetical protein